MHIVPFDIDLMKNSSFLYKVFRLYYEGFKNMTLGRTLWTVILIKLFIIFVVLKIFFFPNFIKSNSAEGQEDDFVELQLVGRAQIDSLTKE